MPIDARIPLSATPTPPIDVMQLAGQAMTLRNMGQRNQLYQSEIENQQAVTLARQQALEDEKAINVTIQRHAAAGQVDPYKVADDLARAGRGSAAASYMQHAQAGWKAEAERVSTVLKNSAETLKITSGLLRDVTPETYPAVRQQIAATLPIELVDQYLPQTYDKTRIDAVVQGGMEGSERTAQASAIAAKLRDGVKTKTDLIGLAGQALSVYPDDQSYAQTYKILPALGVPPDVIALFPPPGTPKAWEAAAQLAMTPEKRAELAGQTETRKETARQNKAGEEAERTREKRLSAQGGEAPSAAGRATAERWLQGQFKALENASIPLSGEELTRAKLDAVNSARRQISKAPVTTLPSNLNRWADDDTGAPPALFTPAPNSASYAGPLFTPGKPAVNGPPPPLSSHGRPAPPMTASEAEPSPEETTAAPAGGGKTAMTRAKAATILQGIAGRAPTKAEIDRFMQRNPFEQ